MQFPVAVLSESSKKGQDRDATLQADNGTSAFGVFDGHGGTECAQALKDGLLPRLVSDGFPSDAEIADAFWKLDEVTGMAISMQDCHAGSTCTVLVVTEQERASQREASSTRSSTSATPLSDLRCKLAWVRRCRARVVEYE